VLEGPEGRKGRSGVADRVDHFVFFINNKGYFNNFLIGKNCFAFVVPVIENFETCFSLQIQIPIPLFYMFLYRKTLI